MDVAQKKKIIKSDRPDMPASPHPLPAGQLGPRALRQSWGFLCRGLCHNPGIPTRIESYQSLSLGYT